MKKREKKFFSRFKEPLTSLPNLVEMQTKSFDWLLKDGLKELFQEFSNITDYSGKKFELEFTTYSLDEPKFDEYYAKENNLSYETPLRVNVKLKNKALGTEKEQEMFVTDFPLMTPHGTFIINGVERVIVPQLARSFGVIFNVNQIKGRNYFGAKVIPSRGAWLEIETEADGVLFARIDRKRKFPVSSLLRFFAEGKTDKEIENLFDDGKSKDYLIKTFAKDSAKDRDTSIVEIYSRLRDGDLATATTAGEFLQILFGPERYDLSHVGRVRFNARFDKETKGKEVERRTLNLDDVVTIIKHIVHLNETSGSTPDDIDHLGSRRVRCVGEMLQQKLRFGFTQVKRNVQDRMSTVDAETTLPIQLVSTRPLQARLKEFFTTNQLSQFMGQENVLSEVEHLRRLSALGPGGLTRERAGFEVRDVHSSHYGRVCPIQTPEGPNIGLILTLSSYSRINDLGIIETPYAKVTKGKVTGDLVYMNALEEEDKKIAHGATPVDEKGHITNEEVEVRHNGEPTLASRDEVDYIDVAPNQAFSLATSMIPFLEHNNANRALMGSNMQRQATPCIVPEAPLVGTGIEEQVARWSGRVVVAEDDGVIEYVDANRIDLKTSKGKKISYDLKTFSRTNAMTTFHQRPLVSPDQKVRKGEVLADTSTTDHGQVAIGQNVMVAFMSWEGANYEDAIILSQRLVKDSKFTTIHIEDFTVDVRDTKLGPEVTTHDIPNVGEAKLKDLDEEGVIRIGAEVGPGDIMVGKITPKGESELTPEERLLRSIFGEKARDVKDSSLKVPHGKRGRVIGVKTFSRERGDKLDSGVIKRIVIEIAQLRNVSVGDKLSGRHGNKGVISKILPEEDMPYMKDGTPVDVILTPLGVPSRMNLGQILELHMGLAANTLGYQAISPTFIGATTDEIKGELKKAGYPENGKLPLYDGHTGEKFEQDVSIGFMYMLKLHHMVEDKIHMRSIGPYSLITQQPLGGRAQGGGQRFGEMEVWALEGYGASYTLREMLTVKSDDILGRAAAFDAIVKGRDVTQMNIPASFNVLLNEMRGLALDIELIKTEREE